MVGASGLEPPLCWGFDASDPRFSSLKEQCFRLTSYLLIPAAMLINESVKVISSGFTLEVTVSSSDSEITQWLLLQLSAFPALSIVAVSST